MAPRAALVIGCALACFVCAPRGAAAQPQGVPVSPAGIPQAPTAPTPSSSGAVQGSAGWLNLGDKTRERRSPAVIAVPWSTDAPWLPNGWSFRFESPATCTGCPDRAGLGVPNANALWQTSGTLAWQVGAGMISVRVTGQRGAALPLFMTSSASANDGSHASDVIMSDTRTQWVVTLSAEQTVLAFPRRTMSLFGDFFFPLGSTGRAPTTVDLRTPAQTALIGGVRLRSK
jgi:hypothetical protein